MQEADGLRHNHIGPEHLFLGLLRADRSLAASILTGQGVTLEAARDQIGSEPAAAAFYPIEENVLVLADYSSDSGARLDVIKLLVEQLSHTDADSVEGRSLVARIHRAIDALRPHLGG